MPVVGNAQVPVEPTFTGFQRQVDKAASGLSHKLADAGKKGGEEAGKETGRTFGNRVHGSLLSMAARLAGPIAALFAADKIKDFAKTAYEEARESQKVGARTANVIKSTGGAAKITAKQVGALSTAISNKTGIDDEAIQSGANMLLTFKNIRNEAGKGNDIFSQSTSILTDMSAAMGTDPQKAAIQLGKALNDPVKGVSALSRVGVTFDDQQKKTIASMVKQGKTADAQKIILRELKSEFGGAAAAQSTAGEKAATAWANFQEALGTKFLPVIDRVMGFMTTKGIPALSKFTDMVFASANGIAKAVEWGIKYKGILLPAAAALGVLTAAVIAYNIQQKIAAAGGLIKFMTQLSVVTKAQAVVQGILNAITAANPFVLLAIAIAAAVAALIVAYKTSDKFRAVVNGVFKGIKTVAVGVFNWFRKDFVGFFTTTLPNAGKSVLNWFGKQWGRVTHLVTAPLVLGKKGAIAAWDGVTGAFRKSKDWVGGTWHKGWGAVSGWIGNSVNKGKDLATGALDKTKAGFSKLKGWAGGAWKREWSGIKNWVSDPVGSAKNTVSFYSGKVRDVFNGLDNFGRKIFGKRWDGIKSVLTAPVRGALKIVQTLFGKNGGFRKAFNGFIDAAKGIFDKLKQAVTHPIRTVLDAINVGLIKGGINWILGKLGVSKAHQIPWIPIPKGFRRGGSTGNVDPNREAGVVHGDEHVVTHEEVQRTPGKHHTWERLRALARNGMLPGFRGGGRVWPTNTHRLSPTYPGHSGVDIAAGMGAPIYATEPGRVAYTGWGRGYGDAIFETFASGMQAVYGHSSKVLARAGQRVSAGALLGLVGATGHATGPHLHFEVNSPGPFGNSADRANSLAYLNGATLSGHGGGGIGGALGGIWDFLKGLSPVKWLRNKASQVGSGLKLGGQYGAALAMLPGFLIDKAASSMMSKLFSGTGQWTGPAVGGWSSDQLNNAAAIISVAKQVGVGQRGAQIGLMTAMQESTLRNLTGGDRDSVGLFQQRGPWGSYAARHNPAQAARMFFLGGAGGQRGLTSFPWQRMGLGEAAQAVQVSAFPGAYDKWAGRAGSLVARSFDAGIGVIPTGTSLVNNGTGSPEMLVDPSKWGAAPTIINITVDGTLNDDRTIGNLLRAIEQYQRRRGPVRITTTRGAAA